jgi:hypothetical protein
MDAMTDAELAIFLEDFEITDALGGQIGILNEAMTRSAALRAESGGK